MIVDANVMVSAVLGRSLPLLAKVRTSGIELRTPVHQIAEAFSVVRRKRAFDGGGIQLNLHALSTIIDELEPETYVPLEQVARARLGKRGQPDWPVLAAALALDDSIWSNDRDFFGVGVRVWSTANTRFAIADDAGF